MLDRWSWEDQAYPAFVNAREHGEQLALLIVDLDGFKWINDELGHLAGDTALRAVGAALTANTRRQDVVGRYGGDEFLVLLPDTAVSDAVGVASRALDGIAAITVEVDTVSGTTVALTGLTASAGLAVLDREHDHSLPNLTLRADAALYEAKRRGRGRVRNVAYRHQPSNSPGGSGAGRRSGRGRIRLLAGGGTKASGEDSGR